MEPGQGKTKEQYEESAKATMYAICALIVAVFFLAASAYLYWEKMPM